MDQPSFLRKQKQALNIQQITLEHIKEILKISRTEFGSQGYWNEIIHEDRVVRQWIPDGRKLYSQSVRSLADTLIPFFDDQMMEEYEELMNRLSTIRKQIMEEKLEAIKKSKPDFDEDEYEVELEQAQFFNDEDEHIRIQREQELLQLLYQRLQMLLKRIDYMKGAEYAEGGEEEDITDVDKPE